MTLSTLDFVFRERVRVRQLRSAYIKSKRLLTSFEAIYTIRLIIKKGFFIPVGRFIYIRLKYINLSCTYYTLILYSRLTILR